MAPPTLESLIAQLLEIRDEPRDSANQVLAFQARVFAGLPSDLPSAVADILSRLAYDLDFFEPSSELRSKDLAYYDEHRLEAEVREALDALRLAGVAGTDRMR